MNIGDFPDPEAVIHFTTGEYWMSGIFTALAIVATILDLVIIYAITQDRSKSPGTRLISSLLVADLLFTAVEAIFGLLDLIHGGWSTGKIGCLWSATLILTGQCASLLSLSALCIERILVIRFHYYLTKQECYIITGTIWSASIACCLYPIYTASYPYVFGLGPSKVACAISWWETKPLALLAISIVIVVVGSGFLLVSSVYTWIYFHYRHLNRKKSEALQRQERRESDSAINSKDVSQMNAVKPEERALFIKCVSITACFFLTWTPYMLLIFISLATSRPVSSEYDGLATIAVAIYSVLNAIVLILLDNRIKSSVFQLMNWKIGTRIASPRSTEGRSPQPVRVQMGLLKTINSEGMTATVKMQPSEVLRID
jgi:hypothetical protein